MERCLSKGISFLYPCLLLNLTATKRRPVLVLSSTDHNNKSLDVVLAAITSNLTGGGMGVIISSSDLERGQLAVDSRVCADKIYTLSQSIIVKRFGRLNEPTFLKILTEIDKMRGR